jgi:hypothetical protein
MLALVLPTEKSTVVDKVEGFALPYV